MVGNVSRDFIEYENFINQHGISTEYEEEEEAEVEKKTELYAFS